VHDTLPATEQLVAASAGFAAAVVEVAAAVVAAAAVEVRDVEYSVAAAS